jgi:hypothetical protein
MRPNHRTWLKVGLFLFLAILLSLGLDAIVTRRLVPLGDIKNDVSGVFVGVMGGQFGLLVSFLLVAVWERRAEAEDIVAREASAAGNLIRLGPVLPPAVGAEVTRNAHGYLKDLFDHEWDLMAREEVSDKVTARIDALWAALMVFVPSTAAEQELYRRMLHDLTGLGEQRRLRLVAMVRRVPTMLWVVIAAGVVAALVFSTFLASRSALKWFMLALTAAEFVLAVVAVVALQNPFRGAGRLHKEELEHVYGLLAHGHLAPTPG